MSISYLNRLIAIREMFSSPLRHTVQEAYNLLFELWLEYKDNPDFNQDLSQITKEHPMLLQELEARRQNAASPVLSTYSLEKDHDFEKMESYIPKIFISYSHKDEKYKDDLVKMLVPLQTQGDIEIWQDREIKPGDEWYQAIRSALNTCDLALLLISVDFLSSRFIQDKELPRLLQRRKEEGLRVVPIIIRSCLWHSEPVLKDLQVLPKDGKPVISFKGAGEQDRIWTEIGRTVESIARRLANVR